jgi:hypothetical protein
MGMVDTNNLLCAAKKDSPEHIAARVVWIRNSTPRAGAGVLGKHCQSRLSRRTLDD